MKEPYVPRPVDISGTELPPELAELTELLARNTHELWARQRMREGWVYGDVRDDQARTHPDLVPYEALPESEKVYDRQTSMETLRLILALGYRLIRDP